MRQLVVMGLIVVVSIALDLSSTATVLLLGAAYFVTREQAR